MNPTRFTYIETRASLVAPEPEACERLATNQIGYPSVLSEPLPDVAGSGTWEGAVSGATGTHQRYEYVSLGGGLYQQYIVMSDAVGTFQDGENLTGTPA